MEGRRLEVCGMEADACVEAEAVLQSPAARSCDAVRSVASASPPRASPRLARGSTSTGGTSSGVNLGMTRRGAEDLLGAPLRSGCLPSVDTAAGRRETGAYVSAGGVLRRRERGDGSASTTSVSEVVGAAGAQAETRLVPSRRSGRVAARTDEQHVRSRIVTGFDRRIDDVAAYEAHRTAEEGQRAAARRNEGTRGRMTGFGGEDLDRGAGGAWHAGRR